MKKILASALSIALLLTTWVTPALAFDSEAFREQNADALESRGIFLYGTHEFRDGLMPVLVSNTWNYTPFADAEGGIPETVWNYINEDLEIVDLNRGRFTYVYPFFEGLAAVISDEGGVGYIDKAGKIVIPCQYGTVSQMGDVYTGYFKDGVATVLKDSYTIEINFGNSGSPIMEHEWEVGKIDKTGNLVQAYQSVPDELTGKNLIADMGYMPDAAELLEEPESSLSFVINMCTPAGWVDKGSEFFFDDGIAYGATATNNGKTAISEHYALISYDPLLHHSYDKEAMSWTGAPYFTGQIHFFEITLSPGESRQYIFSSGLYALSSGDYKFLWVKMDSAQEMEAFKSAIPFSADGMSRAIDPKLGAQWMEENFHITPSLAK